MTCAHCQDDVPVTRPAKWNGRDIRVCGRCWRCWEASGDFPPLPDVPGASGASRPRPQCLDDIERTPLKWKGER